MKARAHLRRGAPREGEVSGHERILATASELFYRETIRAIGVDTVVERSGVSKTNTAPSAVIACVGNVLPHDFLFL